MESYRQLQAERWRLKNPLPPSEEAEVPAEIDISPSHHANISIVAVDSLSLESVRKFTGCTGILFGAIAKDGFSIIVDAIYEIPWDQEYLHDIRLPMVLRINKLMGLRPVGILVSNEICARDYLYLARLDGVISYVILMITPDKESAIMLTPQCLQYIEQGLLTASTTLLGRTVNGGLDNRELCRSIALVFRTVNPVVHTGFYRLNRWNHVPTFDDARAFILARRKASIPELHVQLADYHLILFIADSLGESSAERVILAIFQEEDVLIDDLVEVLMSSSQDI